MRRMIPQSYIDWAKLLKEYVVQNGTKTEVGGNLEVDGDLVVNSTLVANSIFPHGEETTVNIGNGPQPKNLDVYGDLAVKGSTGLTVQRIVAPTGSINFGDSAFYGTIGIPISQDDFLKNIHANTTVTYSSYYKIGQFVYAHFLVKTSSFNAGDTIFSIKEGFRPKFSVSGSFLNTNWGSIVQILSNGNVVSYSSATSSNSLINCTFIYEVE